jgi:hypothetical protein
MKTGPAAFYKLKEQISVEGIATICINYIFRVSESWKPVVVEVPSADTSNVPSLTEIIHKPTWRTKTKTVLAEAYILLEHASRCCPYYLHLLIGDIKQPLDILLPRFLGRPNPATDIWKLMLCNKDGDTIFCGLLSTKFPSIETEDLPTTLSPALYKSETKRFISLPLSDPVMNELVAYAVWLCLTKVVKLVFEDAGSYSRLKPPSFHGFTSQGLQPEYGRNLYYHF